MPAVTKRSRVAKQKREEGRNVSAKHAAKPPSPNKSDYCPSILDNDGGDSATDVESGNDGQRESQAGASVVALQCLYAVFLPLHLQLDQNTQERR